MTKLYLDTEFNGFGGKLISLALVPWPSKSAVGNWYECMESADPYEPWVAENVIPILGKPPISKNEFRASFVKFVQWFDCPEIIADWHTDVMHFCQLLEGDSFQESVPFGGKFTIIQTPEGEPKPSIPHNALSDAQALMEWHQGLRA
jgi:hypothetical protein